jgi:hypothetical protein
MTQGKPCRAMGIHHLPRADSGGIVGPWLLSRSFSDITPQDVDAIATAANLKTHLGDLSGEQARERTKAAAR